MNEFIEMLDNEKQIININEIPESRSKKFFEYEKFKRFLKSYYENFQEFFLGKEIEIIVEESPDFIIKTDNKKVGVELIEDIDENIMPLEDWKSRIFNKVREFVEKENLKITIDLDFSENVEIKSIDIFMDELQDYIMKRLNKEYKSFSEYCSKSESSSICCYLSKDPFSGNKMEVPFVTMGEASYRKKINYVDPIKKLINKKIKNVLYYKQKTDNINLLIFISLLKESSIEFSEEDQQDIKKMITKFINKQGFNNIYIFYDKNTYFPSSNKHEGSIIIKAV
jgi:hypothetical protein